MVFSNNPHRILIVMISFIIVTFASALDVSNAVAEAPRSGSGGADGLLPLAEKHVVIHNVVFDAEPLNVHCKSTENDLGTIQIPFDHSWDFRFHVNMKKTTKFRCHFTWYGGGSHYFNIFDVARDDTPSGRTPVCKECIWEVGKNGIHELPMCRINRDGSSPYCFEWDDKSL